MCGFFYIILEWKELISGLVSKLFLRATLQISSKWVEIEHKKYLICFGALLC